MRTEQPTTLETDGEVGSVKLVYPPPPHKLFITGHSKAVFLLWFYVAVFGVRVSVTFHLTFLHIILVRFGC